MSTTLICLVYVYAPHPFVTMSADFATGSHWAAQKLFRTWFGARLGLAMSQLLEVSDSAHAKAGTKRRRAEH